MPWEAVRWQMLHSSCVLSMFDEEPGVLGSRGGPGQSGGREQACTLCKQWIASCSNRCTAWVVLLRRQREYRYLNQGVELRYTRSLPEDLASSAQSRCCSMYKLARKSSPLTTNHDTSMTPSNRISNTVAMSYSTSESRPTRRIRVFATLFGHQELSGID